LTRPSFGRHRLAAEGDNINRDNKYGILGRYRQQTCTVPCWDDVDCESDAFQVSPPEGGSSHLAHLAIRTLTSSRTDAPLMRTTSLMWSRGTVKRVRP
jgi:hypothetical protein